MSETYAIIFWSAVAVYAALGAFVALSLIVFGLRRVDPSAAAAVWRVKLLLMPGMIAFWPIILARLMGRRPGEDAQ